MDLERGVLAKIDRKLLAGLSDDERFRMVRVPVTMAVWSTWKRYCGTVGSSMGRAIAELINGELAAVSELSGDGALSRLERAERRLAERDEALDGRERMLAESEERLRRWSEHLRRSEHEVVIREQRLEAATKMSAIPVQTIARTGRNGPCPCRSGRKYKRCHGAPGRSATGEP
jgi:hypothetical protein